MYVESIVVGVVVFALALLVLAIARSPARRRSLPPVRILGIWPDTVSGGIDVQREVVAMFDSPAWNLVPLRGDVTTVDVVTFLSDGEYEIVHIGSHSSYIGVELSGGYIVSGGWLARVFRHRGIKLVVLNSCESHAIGQSLKDAGIEAVITTLDKVKDTEAVEFARAFYKNLGRTRIASVAFDEAVLAAGPESWSMFSLSGNCKL